jgi:hypothetical protein
MQVAVPSWWGTPGPVKSISTHALNPVQGQKFFLKPRMVCDGIEVVRKDEGGCLCEKNQKNNSKHKLEQVVEARSLCREPQPDRRKCPTIKEECPSS